MKGLLKCYYGYRNRGDELLFFGVVKYLFDHYDDLTVLDVEVGDVSWMNQWCELNHDLWDGYKSRVRFVPSRTFGMWVADYDIIYLGGGEVLAAQTRSFWHGGVNYFALFWRWIWTKRVVRLGGVETPVTWRSKLLYRMMLSYAREIMCREQGSYEIARRYTDKVVLYHDWAIDILEAESGKLKAESVSDKKQKIILLHGKKRPQTNTIDGWMKWVGDQLIDKGYEVIIPFVDKSWEIGRSGWEEILNKYDDFIDENTIFVGHSAGAAALVRWLGKHQIIIQKLILVAPGYIPRPYEEGRVSTQTGEILTKDADAGMRDLYNFEIKSSFKDFVQDGVTVFTSNDEQRLLDSAEKYILTLDAKHLTLDDRGHFNGSYGPQNETFSELIEEIVGDVDLQQRADYGSAPMQEIQRTTHVVVPTQQYVLINLIPKHTNQEIITQFHEWLKDYPGHQIINFPAEEGDMLPEEIITQYGDRIQMWKWWERDIRSSLTLFEQTQAGFGQRLHFIIPCVYYHIPIYRLAYSEKVDKILQFFEQAEL